MPIGGTHRVVGYLGASLWIYGPCIPNGNDLKVVIVNLELARHTCTREELNHH